MGIIVIDPPPPPPPPPKFQRSISESDWKEIWEYCFNVAQLALTPRYVFKPSNTEGEPGA